MIAPLDQRRDLIPTVASLFAQIWPDHYGPDGPGKAGADLAERCRPRGLPFAVVACQADGCVLGSGTLSGSSYGAEAGETPWITGLCVAPDRRHQGIASAIVTALEAHARRTGFDQVFATTISARGLLERQGFAQIRELADAKPLWSVLRKGLQTAKGAPGRDAPFLSDIG